MTAVARGISDEFFEKTQSYSAAQQVWDKYYFIEFYYLALIFWL